MMSAKFDFQLLQKNDKICYWSLYYLQNIYLQVLVEMCQPGNDGMHVLTNSRKSEVNEIKIRMGGFSILI